MSLHALAGHMAAKGRGSDSMLVHMTPEEVQSLQVLALKGGGTLTINPETGLPEANFLKKMLPMIAGAALNFFAPGVGTAVGGMFGLGAAAGTGLAVGGISALATGSLSRGLMAGLGAYGGASLAGSLANAGTGALSSEAANAALAEAGVTDALSPAADEVAQRAIGERLASATPYDKLATGFKAVTDSPAAFGNFAKNNIGAGLAAISPMMADEGVQTTTKRPDTGMIRNYTFDPYGQTYTSAGNYPASEYKGMARGGIVALADGGTAPAFTPFSGSQINQYIRDNNLDAAGIAAATQQFNVDPNAVINAQNAQEQIQDVYRNVLGRDVDPSGLQYWTDRIVQGGISGQDMYNEFLHGARANNEIIRNPNLTLDEALRDYSGFTSSDQTNIADEWVRNTLGREVTDADRSQQWYKDATNASAMNTYDTAQNIFGQFKDYATRTGQNSVDAYADALAQISGMGLTEADVLAQTGKTLRELVRGPNLGLGLFEASQLTAPGAVFDFNSLQARKTAPPVSIVDAGNLPGGVSGGGNTVVNANGTITTRPNIPGMPEGGFTGMGQVRDAYTAGGGSLGYVNKAPTTMEEFNQRFNKQTGDSLAAYDYLMGKGANNNAYPTKSGVEQIMRPYSEVTTGIPAAEGRPTQKYIFDAATKRYVENPNYRPLSYNSKGERVVGLTPTEVLTGLAPFKDGKNDAGLFDFVTQNNISEAQLAAALGISLAEARARLAAAKKTSTAATNANVQTGGDSYSDGSYSGGGGGSNTASNNAPVESMGTDTGFGGDGAGAGAPGGGNAAGGPGNSGDGGTGDSSTAVKRGGLLPRRMALGGLGALAGGGSASQYNLGSYSDGGRLLRGPGDGVSDSIPATIGGKQPARLADGEFVVPARIVSELGNGSTEAGARKLYAMMDRVQKARGKTTGKKRVAANTRADKYLPA